MRVFHGGRAALAAALLFVLPVRDAGATWSIVLADQATGEVAVGSATCWDGAWIRSMMPVVRVGIGAANLQATWDDQGKNRQLVYDQLQLGTDPGEILALIAAQDPTFQQRQNGVVDLEGRAATQTGTAIQYAWHGGFTGQDGTLTYAIQGNLLTGPEVIAAARDAVLATEGDLADRLMAGMVAARSMGGDGRCSCHPFDPTLCGAPPKWFDKTAHVGFVLVARIGDQDGSCATTGCATGNYWLALEVGGAQAPNPDPVLQLQEQMQAWRKSWENRPDHLQSTATPHPLVLRSDGQDSGVLVVRPRDWRGVPLQQGGANVTVTVEPGGDGVISLGPVLDAGDGTYEVPLLAGVVPGLDRLRIVVDDGQGPVTLYPFTEVRVARADALLGSPAVVSAAAGDDVVLQIDAGSGLAGWPYLVLMSLSGTAPGFGAGPTHVPLNQDTAFWHALFYCGHPPFHATYGILDGAGRGTAGIVLAPNDLAPLVPGRLDFALLSSAFASDPTGVVIGP